MFEPTESRGIDTNFAEYPTQAVESEFKYWPDITVFSFFDGTVAVWLGGGRCSEPHAPGDASLVVGVGGAEGGGGGEGERRGEGEGESGDDGTVGGRGGTVFPVFVNEAAYIQPPPNGSAAGIAFLCCEREMLSVPPLLAQAY